ncbi:MAG: DUF1549 and DUF1553 domain-containing protein, partial [bacterium]
MSPVQRIHTAFLAALVLLSPLIATFAADTAPGGKSASATNQQKTPQILRMTYYRGPGTTDRDLGPKVCDGDPETEWKATGLTRTTLGPPFEFVLETIDGQPRDFAGVRILSASVAPNRRLDQFEIRAETNPGSGDYDRLVYRGQQLIDEKPQSHLFDQPVRSHRLKWIMTSNHGDRNEFRVNELWPIFDAAQTAQSGTSAQTGLPLLPLPKIDATAASKYVYQPLKTRNVPEIADDNGRKAAPIDAWLLTELRQKGLSFAPMADPVTLIRRLSYNLTGLPPSADDITRFKSSPTDKTYAAIVEKYLADKTYGENQARFWLDVVRYADTDGYAADGIRPDAWRYRDYVIKAFNDDKPYAQFLTEQLAADELESRSAEILPALGMARLGPFRTNSGNQNLERNRQELITEVVANVSLTFLGLTIGCARCHDHKIDPIPQADYYRFAAFFAATEPALLPLASPADEARHEAASDAIRREMEPFEAKISAIRGQASGRLREKRQEKLDEATKLALKKPYDQRTDAEVALVKVVELELEPKEVEITAALGSEEKAEIASLEKVLAGLRKKRPEPLPTAWGLKDAGSTAPATFLLHRGQIENKSGVVEPRVPAAFQTANLSEIKPGPGSKSGTIQRRLSLARWMTGPGRDQVARVIVNRIWQQHFGRGLVGTANNFGDLGDDPVNPNLLDWLAADFIANGWSIKGLHRKITTSLAFRQSSRASVAAVEKDPGNDLFSRQNRRRLAAEELRDSMLQISGQLNLTHRGGPGVAPPLAPEVLERLKTAWRPTKDENSWRARSIYLLVDRNLVMPILEEFDRPDSMTSCARRNESTHALQSLAMMNNPWVIEQARAIGKLMKTLPLSDDNSRMAWLYEKYTGHTADELTLQKLLIACGRTRAA